MKASANSSHSVCSGICFALGAVLFASAVLVAPAYARAPEEGMVVEGLRAPKMWLGDSRKGVLEAYGKPTCSGSSDPLGTSACSWGWQSRSGIVIANFRGLNGGPALGRGDDVIESIMWERLPEWYTTAGINTQLALEEMDMVASAYPAGEVYITPEGTMVLQDQVTGIQVEWFNDPVTGAKSTRMAIFFPTSRSGRGAKAHAADVSVLRFDDAEVATVLVEDEEGRGVAGALVSGTWSSPREQIEASAVTDGSGRATLRISTQYGGGHQFTVGSVDSQGLTSRSGLQAQR